MGKVRELLHTQALKLTLRPYTINSKADITYFTEFQNGFATALIPKYSGYYSSSLTHFEVSLINDSFKAVISTQYTCSSDSSWLNGYVIATNHNYPDSKKRVFLDKELKEVPDKQFYSIQQHENCFIVSRLVSSDKYNRCVCVHGILDKNLKEILPLEYHTISPISTTRFYCQIEDKTPIIFDASDRKIYTLEGVYSISKEFENGYYRFRASGDGNLFGYFDHNFNIAIEPKYQKLGDFDKNGFAPFARDNVVGVVDMHGKEFIR